MADLHGVLLLLDFPEDPGPVEEIPMLDGEADGSIAVTAGTMTLIGGYRRQRPSPGMTSHSLQSHTSISTATWGPAM
jgi:hypothetical protein